MKLKYPSPPSISHRFGASIYAAAAEEAPPAGSCRPRGADATDEATLHFVEGAATRRRPVPPTSPCKSAPAHFFWLDVYGGDAAAREPLLRSIGVSTIDDGLAPAIGQACRMQIGEGLPGNGHVVVAPTGGLLEVHLLCAPRFVVTASFRRPASWTMSAWILRQRADRPGRPPLSGGRHSPPCTRSTLNEAITELDSRLNEQQLLATTTPVGATTRIRSAVAGSSSSRSGRRSAGGRHRPHGGDRHRGLRHGSAGVPPSWNDCTDLVADVEHRLHERILWLTNILRRRTRAWSSIQSDQINRLAWSR